MDNQTYASARWTSRAKSGVGTARSADSGVWFTLSHGIFSEIYYPRSDQAWRRDVGLIVTDPHWRACQDAWRRPGCSQCARPRYRDLRDDTFRVRRVIP